MGNDTTTPVTVDYYDLATLTDDNPTIDGVDLDDHRFEPDGDPAPLVTQTTVRLSRNAGRDIDALELILRWHGPEHDTVDKHGRSVRHRGQAAIGSAIQPDYISRDRLEAAVDWLDLLEAWAHADIAECTPHMGDGWSSLGHLGMMATAIVEARVACLRDIEAARPVIARMIAATKARP